MNESVYEQNDLLLNRLYSFAALETFKEYEVAVKSNFDMFYTEM